MIFVEKMDIELLSHMFRTLLNEHCKNMKWNKQSDVDKLVLICYQIEKAYGETYHYEALLLISYYVRRMNVEKDSQFFNRVNLFDKLHGKRNDLTEELLYLRTSDFNFVEKMNIQNKIIGNLNYSYSNPQDSRILNFIKNNKILKLSIKHDYDTTRFDPIKSSNNNLINVVNFVNEIGIYPHLKKLIIGDIKSVDMFKILQNFPNLEYLELNARSFLGKFEKSNFKLLNNDIKDDIKDNVNSDVKNILNCDKLKHLKLSHFSESLENDDMINIIKICPNLETFFLKFCDKINDSCIVYLTETCKNITSIDISYCANITMDSMYLIVQSYPNLEYLDISCNKFDENFVIFAIKNLKKLKKFETDVGFDKFMNNEFMTDELRIVLASKQKYFNSLGLKPLRNDPLVENFINESLTEKNYLDFLIKIDKKTNQTDQESSFWNFWYSW